MKIGEVEKGSPFLISIVSRTDEPLLSRDVRSGQINWLDKSGVVADSRSETPFGEECWY
jgi:hypothetical protein